MSAIGFAGLPIAANASIDAGDDRAAIAPSVAGVPGTSFDSDGDGTLDRVDAVSAAAAARAAGEPVEDLSARSEASTTVVNPNGTRTVQDFGSPVRVQSQDGSWHNVNFDLAKQADGTYAPKVSATDTAVGGGGSTSAAAVTFDDGSTLGVTWPQALPEPAIDGGVATYKLDEAMDLVVAVVDGGVSTTIRLNQKPSNADRALVVGLMSDGLKVAETAQGGLQATNEDGYKVGRAGTMTAWDSRTDAAGDPLRTVPVDAALTTAGGTGFDKTQELSLVAPDALLDDPTTVYPVTIDPDISSVTRVRDTFVQNGDATSNGTSHGLVVGATTGNTANPGVTFAQFDTSALSGKTIVSSEMGLWQYYGYTCADRHMLAQPVGASWVDAITWSNRPAGRYGTGDDGSLYDNRGASGCADGWSKINVTNMVAAWAAGTYPNYGFRLAVPSASETYPSFERRFCSMNPNSGLTYCNGVDHKPYLSVTYNTTPNRPSGLAVNPVESDQTEPATPSLTPTFRVTSSDPDGNAVRSDFEVSQENESGRVLRSSGSVTAASGAVAAWTTPSLEEGEYSVRVRAWDGAIFGPWTNELAFTVNATDDSTVGLKAPTPDLKALTGPTDELVQSTTFDLPVESDFALEAAGEAVLMKQDDVELGSYWAHAVDDGGDILAASLRIDEDRLIVDTVTTSETEYPVVVLPSFTASDADLPEVQDLYPGTDVLNDQESTTPLRGTAASQLEPETADVVVATDESAADFVRELSDPIAMEGSTGGSTSIPSYIKVPKKLDGNQERYYFYDPKAKDPKRDPWPKPWHDYCTKSPDTYAGASFKGPCARHDLCIEFKLGERRSHCDSWFQRDLKINCDDRFDGFLDKADRWLCRQVANRYHGVVKGKTKGNHDSGNWGHSGASSYPRLSGAYF